VISSYPLVHRDVEQLRQVQWGRVILDESQNIKNHDTRQAHAARELSGGYKIAMTGTTVENHVPIQSGVDKTAVERLRKLTGPFILRRLKSDKSVIADLPDKLEMKVYCNLTKEQAALYDSVVQEALNSVDRQTGMKRKAAVLSMLLRLKQICNHPAHYLRDGSKLAGRSGKLSRLTEMLEEVLEVNEKALIFSQFAEMGKLLEEHLKTVFPSRTLRLDGSVPAKHRQQMVDAFESTKDDSPKLFVLSLKAGGTGINLTAANHVFHFDRWWNPAVENQATDRAYRIGQMKNVQVHKFVCTGTLEETIDEMIEKKRTVAEDVVGAGEGWLTELSTTELRDILMLRKDAVGE
jgi:SNF2 family DNA or RNA helicase